MKKTAQCVFTESVGTIVEASANCCLSAGKTLNNVVAITTGLASVQDDFHYSGASYESQQMFELTQRDTSHQMSSWDSIIKPVDCNQETAGYLPALT